MELSRVGECLDTALTLEPDESDHFRIRPARFAVQPVGCVELAMMHRPASRCYLLFIPDKAGGQKLRVSARRW